ncbi:uncharacterized protein GIQ15_00210 [Arthroderma uncinatum]|uniref:uncharacterized protein n=1 Tax=Arthroderma uncinatum TaxID=74035 RepID=UPI00144AF0A9|nr:uncharacterized protein GIQ15_00210 [Arthroderma uncinatum]KAF3490693.1 hypothetical protein GIQ15_00210 [Arthroderma uncinatum]
MSYDYKAAAAVPGIASEESPCATIPVKQPTVSTRRRLQNRIAQRKYREKKASSKQTFEESSPDEPWTPQWNIVDGRLCIVGNQEFAEESEWFLSNRDMLQLGLSGVTHQDSSSMTDSGGAYADLAAQLGHEAYAQHVPVISSEMPSATTQCHVSTPAYMSEGASRQLLAQPTNATPNPSEISRTPFSVVDHPSLTEDGTEGSRQREEREMTMQLQHTTFSPQDGYSSVTRSGLANNHSLEPVAAVSPILHLAVQSRNRGILSLLLKHADVAVDERDKDGYTALHIAVKLGDEALVSLLLRHSASAHICDLRGQNALYLAVSGGHENIVKLLLEGAEQHRAVCCREPH